MHIIVYGIGAVGGFYSSLIADAIAKAAEAKSASQQSYHKLSLIARPSVIKAIETNGYIELRTLVTGAETTINKIDKKYFNLANSYADLEINPDDEKLVMLCVKSKDTSACAEDIKSKFDAKTTVLSVQNGVSNEEKIEAVLGEGSVLGCLTNVAAEYVEPGVYLQIYNPVNLYRLQFGELKPERGMERVNRIHQVLSDMGLTAKASTEIIKDQWSKLVWNSAFNPLSALYRANLGTIAANPQAAEEALGIMNETTQVANSLGIGLDPALPEKHWEITNRKEWASFRTSMLQDLEAGKDIEIDELLGLIIEKAKILGIQTPYAERVFQALSKSLIVFIIFFFTALANFIAPVSAIELPVSVKSSILKLYPEAKFRFDGILETKNKSFLLLINPADLEIKAGEELSKAAEDLIFGNSYIFTPIENNTIKSYHEFSPEIKEKILGFIISPDFLIPKDFSIPRDIGVISGELPIKLRNTELATVKEKEFKNLMAAEKAKELKFLLYSSLDNSFALLNLIKNVDNIKPLEKLNTDENLIWVSKINRTKKNILLSDYSSAKIFELDEDIKTDNFKLKELIDLSPFIKGNGLLDFDIEHKVIFAISQKDSKIYSINLENKKIISEIQLPSLVTEMETFDFSSNAAKLLVLNSKGSNQISFVDTSNYQISQILRYKKGDEQNIIFDFVINKDLLVTANEHIKDEIVSGEINVYSSVSKNLMDKYQLNYIPQKLSFIDDGRILLVLGFNAQKECFLTKIDLKTKVVLAEKSLGADIIAAKNFAFNKKESLLVVPSLGSKLIALVDLTNLELVKKIETDGNYDKVLAL